MSIGNQHPLSVAVVTFNEADRIEACLSSVRFADEIVVVDSFSTDRTVELCRAFTDKIMQREWPGWKEQKFFAMSQTANEWVLTLDADEAVSDDLAAEIKNILAQPAISENGFVIPRHNYYLGRLIRHGAWGKDLNLRLYRKSQARFGGCDPHEVIEVPGPRGFLKGPLLHNSYRGLGHQVEQLSRYASVNAEERYKEGVRFHVSDLIFRPGYTFLKEYFFKQGFRDGLPGFIIAVMDSYYTFLKYARLWELGHDGSGGRGY